MLKKLLSLFLCFVLLLAPAASTAGEMSLDEVKILLSRPEKYSKKPEELLSMAVLAGVVDYEKIVESFVALKNKLASKEALLAEMQNARVLKSGKKVFITIKDAAGSYQLNFPALDHRYHWRKANVYEPALEEVRKHRYAYLEYYKSPEVRARLEAAEKNFAAVEKEFKSLEKLWSSNRNKLLKAAAPAEEKALKREITLLQKEIASKQSSFAEAQYEIFKKEYNSLVAALRSKAGLFLPPEIDKFVSRMELDLSRFRRASSPEDVSFARRALKESLERFSSVSGGASPKEIKYYRETLSKFFKDVSAKLSLKSSLPLLSAAGLALYMLSAQSAQAAKISNRRTAVSRTLKYAYVQTPSLMLANVLALRNSYGADLVADVVYEDQEYIAILSKQTENLKKMTEITASEPAAADVVISSENFSLPFYRGFGF
ncbi:hypothetical protein [Candidatus Proelusimicrobium excrementi]|uniref:hypothetical protein n=1 Tax=Candidatus Proelusimicrobium excrementi TaxID=3416222 RepID=UPI003C88CF42|nr:hypothetical protein [Elusimicrobiaceae bacterium]